MSTKRKFLVSVTLAAALVSSLSNIDSSAHAQPLPSRAIKIIVPFGPGGVADLTACTVA